MQIHLAEKFKWRRVGKAVVIEGKVLYPGTFTGIDGNTISYPAELFKNGNIEIINRRIKYMHKETDEAVVGFITGYVLKPDGLYIRGYIFDEAVAELVRNGDVKGLSMEAEVDVDAENTARKVSISAVALVPDPAAPKAKVTRTKVMTLLRRNTEKPVRSMDNMAEQVAEQKKPTREEFFKWIHEQLKKAGIEEADINKIMEVLKAAIKTPYPYPYPKPYPQPEQVKQLEEEKKRLEEEKAKLEAKIKELEDKIKLMQAEFEVKQMAPDINVQEIYGEQDDVETKLAKLEATKKLIKERKVKLEVAESNKDKFEQVVEKVCLETFGKPLDEILREIGGE